MGILNSMLENPATDPTPPPGGVKRVKQQRSAPHLRKERPRRDLTRSGGDAQQKRLMGFEPTTFCMASRRSSQLSYSRASG